MTEAKTLRAEEERGMSEVVKFPKRKVFPRIIKPREVLKQPEPPKEMVWEICPYIGNRLVELGGCHHCPAWENDPDHGKVQRACYGLAAEACRIAYAAMKRWQP